jgi:hypothetical protein
MELPAATKSSGVGSSFIVRWRGSLTAAAAREFLKQTVLISSMLREISMSEAQPFSQHTQHVGETRCPWFGFAYIRASKFTCIQCGSTVSGWPKFTPLKWFCFLFGFWFCIRFYSRAHNITLKISQYNMLIQLATCITNWPSATNSLFQRANGFLPVANSFINPFNLWATY